jgi:arylsulfatase A-like enzyme
MGLRLIVGLVTLCLLAPGLVWAEGGKKPNVLLIITDQQHANMLSSSGNPYLKTPALDKLAKAGVRFTKGYVTNPVCVPSRIAMATGVMAGRFGVLDNGMRAKIPEAVSSNSMGLLMKRAGYDTFYGGKVHMSAELTPAKAGYDVVTQDQRDKLPTDCIKFIATERDKPFFAVASFINPHDICFAYGAKQGTAKGKALAKKFYEQARALPLEALPPLPENSAIPELEPDAVGDSLKVKATTPSRLMRQNYSDRDWRDYRWMYCRFTERVDRQIGEILDAVNEMGLDDNTVIIFTSDHGDMDGSHRAASKNVFYENSSSVPFIMQYRGTIPGGVTNTDSLVSTGLDLLPTICDFAGIAAPDYLLGRSLKQVATGGVDDARRPFVASENRTGRMIRSDRFKYCVYNDGKIRESLVDLKKDPGEMKNLAMNPEYRKELNTHRGHLHDWIEESDDEHAKGFAIAPQ